MEELLYQRLYELEDSHWWFRGRRAVLWAMLNRHSLPSEPRLLDAGCGTGRNLQEFGGLGRADGIDFSPQAVEFCRRRGFAIRQGTLEALPFDAETFDVLLATDVIEHVPDDALALRELRRVARPEAIVVVTVPAYGWLWSEHDDRHEHKRRYTLRGLRKVLEAAGWRTTLATYFNSILLPPIALMRRRGSSSNGDSRTDYELTPSWANGALALPMTLEARLIASGVSLPAGVSIGMVGVK